MCRRDAQRSYTLDGYRGTVRWICMVFSGVSRMSFRVVQNTFVKKWGYLHGALRHAARGKATRLLGGSGACSLRKFLMMVHFGKYFAKIL